MQPSPERNQGWSPCIRWCEQMFGRMGPRWRFVGEGVFEFRQRKDHMLFLLKWG